MADYKIDDTVDITYHMKKVPRMFLYPAFRSNTKHRSCMHPYVYFRLQRYTYPCIAGPPCLLSEALHRFPAQVPACQFQTIQMITEYPKGNVIHRTPATLKNSP